MATSITTWSVEEKNIYVKNSGNMVPSRSTWNVSIADTNNKAISVTGSSFTVNDPTIKIKRTANYSDKTHGAANFALTLTTPSSTLQRLHRIPHDYTNYTWSSAVSKNSEATVLVRDDYNSSTTFQTSAFFSGSNPAVRSLTFSWKVLLSTAVKGNASNFSTIVKQQGMYSRHKGDDGGEYITNSDESNTKSATWNVTVTLNAPPTLFKGSGSYVGPTNTSGNPYRTLTAYKYNYVIQPKYGGYIKTVVLKVGSYTANQTYTASAMSNGMLTDYLEVTPTAAGTYAASLVITDSRNQVTTISLGNKVYVNPSNPSATATSLTSSTTNGFWRGVSTATTNVTASSGVNGGQISSVLLTVGAATGSKNGTGSVTTSSTLNTAGSIVPTVRVRDNYNYDTNLTLSTITVKNPTISVVVNPSRIGSNDLPADEGTIALITATFTKSDIKTTANAQLNYLLKPNVYVNTDDKTNSVTWYSSYSTTGGFSNQISWGSSGYNVGGSVTLYGKLASPTFDINTTYNIGIQPKSTLTTGVRTNGILQAAFYLIAGRRGGRGLGIGMKPTGDAMYIGIPTFFKNSLTLDSGASTHLIAKTLIGTTTSYETRKFLSVYDDGDNNSNGQIIRIGAGGEVVIGAGESALEEGSYGMWVNNIDNMRTPGTGEVLRLLADSSINFYTGCADNASSYYLTTIGTDGVLKVPNDIYAGKWVANTTQAKEYDIYCCGGAGRISMWVAAAANGSKGIWAANAAGTGTTFISVDQNNNATFTGNLTGNCSGSSGSCTGNAANVTGTIAIGHGGTGATTAAAARANLAVPYMTTESYPALVPTNGTNNWIKIGTANTSYGILPSQAGTVGSGHNYIGTSSWYWKYLYVDEINTQKITTISNIFLPNNVSLKGRNSANTAYCTLIYGSSSNNIVVGDEDWGGDLYIHRVYTPNAGTVTYKPNVYISSGHKLSRTTHDNSSQRYKYDIKDVDNPLLDPHRLYNIQFKQFKYNDKLNINKNDCRYNKELSGFIAEQVYECYPIAVDINENGECESWSEHYIVPPMLALLQEQNERIKQLENKIQEIS